MNWFAVLPMYDWPETRGESDALWSETRRQLLAQGVAAPEKLARRNADLPPVPGGIVDAAGQVIAADPATLDPEGFDLGVAWRHPALLFGQTCWGPMEQGLDAHVRVMGQPDYSTFEGGQGAFYSSALLVREGAGARPPADGGATLPLESLRGRIFAMNNPDSMSGVLGLSRDLEAAGESLDIFQTCVETGSHRASIVAVANGQADICAIDCRSLDLARRFEPALATLAVVGWTAHRKGLPYIAARGAPGYRLGGEIVV